MADPALKYICKQLGINSRQLASLLIIPESTMSMALGGYRQIPKQVKPWLELLEKVANNNNILGKNNEKKASAIHIHYIQKQISKQHLQAEKLLLQLERATHKLQQAKRCFAWLPVLLQSELCKADADRRLSVTVMLRQWDEVRNKKMLQICMLEAKLAATEAALGYWNQQNLSFR